MYEQEDRAQKGSYNWIPDIYRAPGEVSGPFPNRSDFVFCNRCYFLRQYARVYIGTTLKIASRRFRSFQASAQSPSLQANLSKRCKEPGWKNARPSMIKKEANTAESILKKIGFLGFFLQLFLLPCLIRLNEKQIFINTLFYFYTLRTFSIYMHSFTVFKQLRRQTSKISITGFEF